MGKMHGRFSLPKGARQHVPFGEALERAQVAASRFSVEMHSLGADDWMWDTLRTLRTRYLTSYFCIMTL